MVEKPIFQMEQVEQGTPRPSFQTPRIISQEVLIAFSLAEVGIKRTPPLTIDNQEFITKTIEETHSQENIQHFCAPVIHPGTSELITSYKRFPKDPEMKEVLETGFGKEWGNLAQVDMRTGAKVTDTFKILRPEQVLLIPNDRVVTYSNIVINYRP